MRVFHGTTSQLAHQFVREGIDAHLPYRRAIHGPQDDVPGIFVTPRLPAWQAFNKAIGTDGSVGIWHETYAASLGSHESVYVNMPPFGLGRAASLQEAVGDRQAASGRLSATPREP